MMLYNILYTYADIKDGKLIIRINIPDNVFACIEYLNTFLMKYGRYRVDSFWLARTKQLAYDFKTTLPYVKFNKNPQNE